MDTLAVVAAVVATEAALTAAAVEVTVVEAQAATECPTSVPA